MTRCNHDAPAARYSPASAPLFSAKRRDLLLTVLLTLMRFNPQEAMIVRAGLRQAAMTLSRFAERLTPRGGPMITGATASATPYALALSCVALILSAGQVTGGMA